MDQRAATLHNHPVQPNKCETSKLQGAAAHLCRCTGFLPSNAELTIVTLRSPNRVRDEPSARDTSHGSTGHARGDCSSSHGPRPSAHLSQPAPQHTATPARRAPLVPKPPSQPHTDVKCVSASGAPVGLPVCPACLLESFLMSRLVGCSVSCKKKKKIASGGVAMVGGQGHDEQRQQQIFEVCSLLLIKAAMPLLTSLPAA